MICDLERRQVIDLREEAGYLHVAQSQFHDIRVAKKLGIQVAWIERRKGLEGYGGSPAVADAAVPDYHFASIAEQVEAVESGQ